MATEVEPNDEEIVRRIRAGDASAARTLFDRHAASIRARIRRRLPPAVRAKVGVSDVLQEAYLAAFLRLPAFEDRGRGSFRAWLHRIVDHKVVDAVRNHVDAGKRDVRREVRLGTGKEPVPRDPRDRPPESDFAAAEERAVLEAAIGRLASDHRSVLRLLHQEGLSASEAGTRMNRSADAVRKLYARALARMADLLDRPEGGPTARRSRRAR